MLLDFYFLMLDERRKNEFRMNLDLKALQEESPYWWTKEHICVQYPRRVFLSWMQGGFAFVVMKIILRGGW